MNLAHNTRKTVNIRRPSEGWFPIDGSLKITENVHLELLMQDFARLDVDCLTAGKFQ
jgi:hypothetical protein